MSELPSGTVTFLFTDIEGSTRLWQEHPDAMRLALARHDELVRDAIEVHGGHLVKSTGDGVHAVFHTATDAVDAAVAAQRAIGAEVWPLPSPLRVRMGIHGGPAELRDGDYYGTAVNRAARIMSVAHGGQIVVSLAAEELARDGDVEMLDLGDHWLKDLGRPERIFQVVHPELDREFPPLRTLDVMPGNLPAQVSSFVGRAREVEDLAVLLGETRVVTLTGVGGVGKTRLAIRVAGEVQRRFGDGAWLVELGGVRDPDAVVGAVATALGAPDRPGTPVLDVLTKFLRSKQMLVVLDNCEHLLTTVAELVQTLERACPDLVVLATSREGLGIAGERLVAVRSLAENEAVQLFVERATAVKDDFRASHANLPAIVEVCRRLDGIPLAIELAAARVAVLSPAQIARRLDQRFRILAGGDRGAIERHATLRAAIDWSFELLTPDEQTVLACLSVFAGGCTLDAAEAVCGSETIERDAVLDHLSNLVSRSLVVADASDPAETSYRLLETIRQYAEEHLDADAGQGTRDRHARYYAEWERAALEGVQSSAQLSWIAYLDREVENLRTAVDWAIGRGDDELAYRMLATAALPPLWNLPAGRAIFDHAERIVDLVREAPGDHLADALSAASVAAVFAGRLERATELSDEALSLTNGRDCLTAARAYATQSRVAVARRDYQRALECWRHFVAGTQADGTMFERSYSLGSLGLYLGLVGEVDEARAAGERALDRARRMRTPSLLLGALVVLAFVSVGDNRDAARRYLVEAAGLRRSFGRMDPAGHDVSLMTLGTLLDEPEAVLWVGAQILYETPAERWILGGILDSLAVVIVARWPERAATLLGACDAIAPAVKTHGPLTGIRASTEASIDAALDGDTATRARELGAHMSEDEATAFARMVIDDAWQDWSVMQKRPE